MNRPSTQRIWIVFAGAVAWIGFLFATSSTVITPHQFFAWIAKNALTEQSRYEAFVVFWGLCWFAIVKGWHAIEYAILFSLTYAILGRLRPLKRSANILIALGFSIAFAISDEYHQTFVPGRGGTWNDVVIDSFGAAWAALWVHGKGRNVDGSMSEITAITAQLPDR